MKKLINWIVQIDRLVYTNYLKKVEQGNFQKLHKFCSWVGLPIPFYTMLLVIAGTGYIYAGYKVLILEAGAFLFSSTINLIIKGLYKRNRPPNNTFLGRIPFDEFSFPSGHAAGTIAVALCISAIIPGLGILLFPWSIFMGISRFLGDFHHPSDIVAGFLVGLILGYILLGLFTVMNIF